MQIGIKSPWFFREI